MASYYARGDRPEGALKRAQGACLLVVCTVGAGLGGGADGWTECVLAQINATKRPCRRSNPSITPYLINTDLISVGNKADALRLLHEAFTQKRHARGGGGQWQQVGGYM